MTRNQARFMGGGTGTGQRGGVSLAALGGVLFLAVLVLLLAVAWISQETIGKMDQAAQQRQGEAVAVMAARQVARAIDREQRQLRHLAQSPALAGAAEAEQGVDVLEAAFPDALRVLVLPAGHDEAQPDAEPPMGFAPLDMLRAAEQAGQAVAPEVHLLNREGSHLNFVQPVLEGERVRAHLVVSYPMDWFSQVMDLPVADAGQLQLFQGHGGRGELLRLGLTQGVGEPHSVHVPNADWVVSYSTAVPAGAPGMLRDPRLPLVFAVVALLLAAAIALVMLRVRQSVRADAAQWTALAREVAAGRVRGGFPMRLSENREAMEVSVAAVSGQRQATAETGQARDTAPGESSQATARSAIEDIGEPESEPLGGLEIIDSASDETIEEKPPVVDASLFRAYDIRGVMGKTLSEDVARIIGRAIGSEAAARGCPDVVVGYDGRLSSPGLADALLDGLRAAGRNVILIGQVPTPVSYFATYHLGTGSCVQVTGSHNPPDYNGFKVMLGGETLSGDAIQDLYRRIRETDFADGEGAFRREDVVPAYLDRIAGDITLHRPLKVVVDAGNGVAGELGPEVLRAIGCEVEELFCEVDGNFPNHHPDPSDPKNLEVLISYVRLQEADVGLAFDGDGDRLGVVDASGKIIWADRQMMLYAMDILSRQPGADIIFDVKCSAHLARVISDNAGVPVMWRTGHSLIKAKLKETGAPLAGEMSGHIFFNDRWDGFDDGIYTAARLLEILSMDSRTSTEVFAELPEAESTPELKIHLEEGEPPEVIERLVAAARFPDAHVNTIDGLRVDFPDGWGLVRASNTTPCLVLRFEADTAEALEHIQQQFRELLEQAKPGIEIGF